MDTTIEEKYLKFCDGVLNRCKPDLQNYMFKSLTSHSFTGQMNETGTNVHFNAVTRNYRQAIQNHEKRDSVLVDDTKQKSIQKSSSKTTHTSNNVVCIGPIAGRIMAKAIKGDFSTIEEYIFMKRILNKRNSTDDVDKKIYNTAVDQMGISKVLADSYTTLTTSSENVVLTTDFISRYKLKLSNLLQEGMSISDIKVTMLGDTYEHLKKNLHFTPSDLRINRDKLNIANMQSLYGVTLDVLRQDFKIDFVDTLIDLFFSVLDLCSLNLTVESIFQHIKRGSRSGIYEDFSKILCYRWFLTNNPILLCLSYPQIKYIKRLLGHTDSWQDWEIFLQIKIEMLNLVSEDIFKVLFITGNKMAFEYLSNQRFEPVEGQLLLSKQPIMDNLYFIFCVAIDDIGKKVNASDQKSTRANSPLSRSTFNIGDSFNSNQSSEESETDDDSDSDEDDEDNLRNNDSESDKNELSSSTTNGTQKNSTLSDMLQNHLYTRSLSSSNGISDDNLMSLIQGNYSNDISSAKQKRRENKRKKKQLRKKFRSLQTEAEKNRYEQLMNTVKSYTKDGQIAVAKTPKTDVDRILIHMLNIYKTQSPEFHLKKVSLTPMLMGRDDEYNIPTFEEMFDSIYYLTKCKTYISKDIPKTNEFIKENKRQNRSDGKIFNTVANSNSKNSTKYYHYILQATQLKRAIEIAKEQNINYAILGLMPCSIKIFGTVFSTDINIIQAKESQHRHKKSSKLDKRTAESSKRKHGKKH